MFLDTSGANGIWPRNLPCPGFYLIYEGHGFRMIKLSAKTAAKVLACPMACVVNGTRRVVDAHPLHSVRVVLRRLHRHFTWAIAAYANVSVYGALVQMDVYEVHEGRQ